MRKLLLLKNLVSKAYFSFPENINAPRWCFINKDHKKFYLLFHDLSDLFLNAFALDEQPEK